MLSPTLILAHAFGARYDLPVPLYLFVLGGAAVVFASFLLVVRREVAPADGPTTGDGGYVAPHRPLLGGLGLLLLAFLIYSGIHGSQEIAENILPTMFWLIVWIGVPISCGVLGDWTPWVNPFATLARLVDRDDLRQRLIGGPALTAVLLFATRSPVPVSAQSGSQTLVIGADHADPAKHPPDSGRLFEYTDFFSLDASLRKGDTIDLRFTPGFSR